MSQPLKYGAMLICAELGKDLDDVSGWRIQEVYDWLAFLKIRAKFAKQGGSSSSRGSQHNKNMLKKGLSVFGS